MKGDELLARVLADLHKAEVVRRESNPERPPQVVWDYVSTNHEILVALLNAACRKRDPERDELLFQHALSAIDDAIKYQYHREVYESCHPRDDDHFDDIRRALQDTKDADISNLDFQVNLSPLDEHGLSRPSGKNFNTLRPAEWDAVRWDIVDIIYGDCQSKTYERCRDVGLDLEKPGSYRSVNFEEDLATVTDYLLDLVKCRAECVIAGFSLAQIPRDKFLNAAINDADYHAGLILEALRLALKPLVMPEYRQALENEFKPFKMRTKELLPRVRHLQPRLAIYEAISRLNSEGITKGHIHMHNEFHDNAGQGAQFGGKRAGDTIITNVAKEAESIDLKALTNELQLLRAKLKASADDNNSEHDEAITAVARARDEAAKGDRNQVLKYLSNAGKWTLDVAKSIAVPAATKALEIALGLPPS